MDEKYKRNRHMSSEIAANHNSSISSGVSLEEPSQLHFVLPQNTQFVITTNRGMKDIITPKLVPVLNKCDLGIRNSVHILYM